MTTRVSNKSSSASIVPPPTGEPPTGSVLFFLGCERSGTTLVQETFTAHYDVASGNESQWVVRHWPRVRDGQVTTREQQRRFLKAVFSDWYFANQANYHHTYFNYEDFLQDGPFDYRRFVDDVFRHIAHAKAKRWVINKTCDFIVNMRAVDEIFDRPKIVYVIRDGRDVALSLLEVKAWGPRSVYGAARRWRDRVETFRAYAEANLDSRILTIRYEDLLERPAEVFEDIARFYGIYDERCHASLTESLSIKSGNREKWRARFSAEELRLFERVAGGALEAHGYQLGSDAADLPPLPLPLEMWLRLRDELSSRLSLYPLWFRALRVVNRVVGRFPSLQQQFFQSDAFAKHFNWNRVIARRQQRGARPDAGRG
jgi:hypothetical protein